MHPHVLAFQIPLLKLSTPGFPMALSLLSLYEKQLAGSQYTSKDPKVETSLLKQLNPNLVYCMQYTLGYGYNNCIYPQVPRSYSWYLLPASPPYLSSTYTATQDMITAVNCSRICIGNRATGTREQLFSTKELRTAASH